MSTNSRSRRRHWEIHFGENGQVRFHYDCQDIDHVHVFEMAVLPRSDGRFEVIQADEPENPNTDFSFATFNRAEQIESFIRFLHEERSKSGRG